MGADCSNAACRADLVCAQDTELEESRCRTTCTSNASCAANENCINLNEEDLVCVRRPIASSTWQLYVGRVRAAATNGGQTWDAGGGAPDLKVCFDVPGKTRVCTPEASDTFDHTFRWVSASSYLHDELAAVDIRIYDVDFTSDDLADTADAVDLRSAWADHSWCRKVTTTYGDILELVVCVVP